MDYVQLLREHNPLSGLPAPAQAAILAIVLPILAVVLNVLSQALPRDASSPPVVFHWFPFIGSAVSYGMDPYGFFFRCREQYGDVFTFVLIGRKVTVALNPKGTNLILNGKLAEVSAEEAYTHLTTPVFGPEVVYDVPNAVLMEQKRLVKFGLTTEQFQAYVPMFEDEANLFFKSDPHFKKLLEDGTPAELDVFHAFSELTILTASRALQGKEVRDSLNKSFAKLYSALDGGFQPIFFAFPKIPLPARFKRDKALKEMHSFYRGIIKARRERGEDKGTDMIASLMGQTYKNGRPLSDTEICGILTALLMAGQHTSSSTGAWMLLELARRPDVVAQLYKEQVDVYGDPSGGFRDMDYESQKRDLPVMDAVIKETLRLHPPIHSIMRKVMSPMVVDPTYAAPKGKRSDSARLIIPKGHFVMASPGLSQIDPRLWENADKFDPSRWLDRKEVADEDDENAEKTDYGWGLVSTGALSKYAPFGAGRHRCIGEQYANLQLGTLVATFVRNFTWKLAGPFPEMSVETMIASPRHPADVVFERRK